MPRSFAHGARVSRKYWSALAALTYATALSYASYAAGPVLAQERQKEQKQGAQASPKGNADLPAYSPEQIQAGQALFAGQCSFCHGRDAGGGEGGPDLTASPLVAEDVRGEKI